MRPDLASIEPATRGEPVEILSGFAAVRRRIVELMQTARSVRGVFPASALTRHAGDAPLLDTVIAGRRATRLLVDPPAAAYLRNTPQPHRGLEVRAYDGPLRAMVLFDDRFAIVPLGLADLTAGGMVLPNPMATQCMRLFESLWSDSHPSTSDKVTLSGRELAVAWMLVRGATDQQVATRMNVSARTVRYVVATLQQRYGTISRMALGFHLGRAGLVADDGPVSWLSSRRPSRSSHP